jgi:hypothetical protein
VADAKDLLESNLAGVSGGDRSVELTVETYPSPDVILLVTPCLDHLKIPSFFTLSPSHQFLAACMEY